MGKSAALLPPLLAMSCFQPELVSGHYRCDRPEDSCPKDFVCHNGLCLDPAQVPDAGEDDMSMPKSDDLRAAIDMRPVIDMRAAIDMRPAMDMRTGCTLVAKEKANEAMACPQTFSGGAPADPCPGGFHLCNKDDDAVLAKVEAGTGGDVKCSALGGFYATAIKAAVKKDKMDEVVCDAKAIEDGWALVGCGQGARALKNDCKGLKQMMPCSAPITSWSCTESIQDATHTSAEPGGLLCCK